MSTVATTRETAIEGIELAAFRDLFAAAPVAVAREGGLEALDLGGAFCTLAIGCPGASIFNRAVGVGTAAPAREADIDVICRHYAERGVDLFLPVAPRAESPELAVWLAERGFKPAWNWMQFTRGVDPLPREAVLMPIRSAYPADAPLLGKIVAEAFGLASFTARWIASLVGRFGWSWFVALVGSTPVGAAGLFVSGATGYLGFGGVLPEYRGRGAQLSLFAARIEAAADLGCNVLVTETGVREPGRPGFSYGNILRAGFDEAYVRSNYVRRNASA